MQKNYLIVPIVKSPNMDSGRFGPIHLQDWYIGLKTAIEIHKKYSFSKIAIITDFKTDGLHEADIYKEILDSHKITDYFISREGFETVGQVEAAKRIADEIKHELILVSTFLHFPRVKYYAGKGVLNFSAWGIPRPKEILRDISMIVLAPFLRLTRLENRFVEMIKSRRSKGLL